MSAREKVLSAAVVTLGILLGASLFRNHDPHPVSREVIREPVKLPTAPSESHPPQPIVPQEGHAPVSAAVEPPTPAPAEPKEPRNGSVPPPKDDAERAVLLANLRGGTEEVRLNALERLNAHLYRNTKDAEVLGAIHAATISDESESVRKYGLYALIHFPDARSFEIIVQSATAAIPQPEEVQIRAMENLRHLVNRSYGMFLVATGCPRGSADAIVRQRVEDARRTLEYLASNAPSENVSRRAKSLLGSFAKSE